MKKNTLKRKNVYYSLITTIALLFLSNLSFSQAPNGTVNLGILTSFEAFTGGEGVANGAGATVNGDVGTHLGIISGFVSPPYTGNTYNANATTAQARKDLLRMYIHLNDLFVDYPSTHGPAFVGTLTPGVYSTDGAGSIGAALTLDGGGDTNAFFIIKFNGALTVGAGATVTLTNGTQSCNVFYIANGAISVAADANIKGTLFSKVGAVGLGANVVLEGRMLTMAGAITIGVGATASPPPCASTIPVFCEADCSPAAAVDVLGVVSDFALFTSLGAVANTGISGINGKVGTHAGAISGYTNGVHIGTEHAADALTAQAALDLDAAYTALMALPNTVTDHAAAFGLGETITAGVYFINGAGSLGGTITLDGQNNTDAIFVFKFAGAFDIAALSKIILANGARRCNVFWIGGAGVTTGAVNIGAASIVKGTFLSHGGACNSGAGVFLSGRQLSTGGAVNTDTGVLYTNPECVTSTPLPCPINAPTVGTITQPTCSIATGSFSITNYNSAYTYVVSPSTGVSISGNTVTAPAGIYTVTAASGACTSIASANVTVNAQPAIPNAPTSGGNQTVCTDGTTNQTLTATATGGTITWYDAATAGNIVTSPTQVGVGTKTYYAQASNGTCSSLTRTAVTLTINSTLAQPTSGAVTQPTCSIATGSFSITNYNSAYTYVVSPSTGVSVLGNTVTAPAGTYTVTATSGACTSIASTSVTVDAQPTAPVQATLGTVTQPTYTTATGSFSITNYNASYTYVVSPSTGVSVSGNTVTAPAGTYTVTATLRACTSIASINIIVNEQPTTLACSMKNMLICKVLTPNNDGFNDYFKITGLEGCNFTFGVKIFNRWGKMVYRSDNYQNDWNGKFDGTGIQIGSNTALPTGTYYCIVTVSGGIGFTPVSGYFYLGTND